jgi:flagellar M-ring protein FliF
MEQILQQLLSFFDKTLNKKQKIAIAISTFLFVLFISFLMVFKVDSNDKDNKYKVLFNSLSDKDSALVIQSLKKDEIKYKVIDDKIYIPKDIVYEQRIKLSAAGIPKNSSIGFELFDKDSFGSTDFEQKIKYLRAIEGELSRTIESLKPVDKAIVHIAIPADTVFIAKKIPPTASIALTIVQNMTMNTNQVQGIKNLVAASIPELTIGNIKVIDNSGQPLDSDSKFASINRLASMQMKYKQKYERSYEDKIIDILSPVVGGKDSITTKVTIEFDFTQTSSTEEVFNPNNIVRSEQLLEEKKDGVKIEDKGGVPGAISNIGPVQGVSDKNKEEYSKTQSTTNYEISKKVLQTEKEFAKIIKINSAVIVDGIYKVIGEDGKKQIKYIPRTKKELQEMETLVKRAVSYNKKREDKVTISNLKFSSPNLKKIKTNSDVFLEILNNNRDVLKYLIAALILYVAYRVAIYPFIEKMLDSYSDELDRKTALVKLSELEEEETNINKNDEIRKKIADQLANGEEDEDHIRYELIFSKIKEYLTESPEEAGVLFTTLIKVDRNE